MPRIQWDDTIVALATPPGIGAIGVIRLSGPQAWTITSDLFPSRDLNAQAPNTLHVGWLSDGAELLDEAVVTLFKGPRSYTGEDVVELSCHGSPFVQQQVIQACLKRGARLAAPGEFTQRAFLHGKLDLTQAEAVADLIASNTEASRRAALTNIRGGFSEVLRRLREQLVQFSALIELELDFSQEDVEFADRKALYALVQGALGTTEGLLRSFKLGNVIKNGVKVAIVGRPNAGKSTLLNTLLNENRAIVSEIAGTTRDTIEEVLNIGGILFRLVDTAGMREHSGDVIERIGIERSRAAIEEAEVVVWVYDVTEGGLGARAGFGVARGDAVGSELKILGELRGKKVVMAGNKVDLLGGREVDPGPSVGFYGRVELASRAEVLISAKDGGGVEELKRVLVEMVTEGGVGTEDVVVTNVRHVEALEQVERSLKDIVEGMDRKITGDLLALDIRRCLQYLGEITGEVSSEEVLGWIFGKFCVGK